MISGQPNVQSALFKSFFRARDSSKLTITVTHESVIIWDCTLPTALAHSRTLALPIAVKSQNQLPLATLINNASKDLGMVLVYPTTGKVVFTENIDSAEALKLFEQRRYSVEGVVSLYGGEVIEEIIDVESAGLILRSSTGRLAHLVLQDAHGHPHVSSTWITPQKGFSLGSFITSFTATWKNRLVAAKTRSIAKGRAEIVALSADGVFRIWEVREGAQSNYIGEIDSMESVDEDLRNAGICDIQSKNSLRYLDLAIFPERRKLDSYADPTIAPIRALILVQNNTSTRSQFIMIDIQLGDGKAKALRIFPITVFEPALSSDSCAQLLLSVPNHSAFIIQDRTAVVLSLPSWKPTNAVIADVPGFYQDLVSFNADSVSEIIAASVETTQNNVKHQKNAEASILLFTKPARALKLVANDFNDRESTSRIRFATAQSKIEQAIFFGDVADSPLDLVDLSTFKFTGAEMESAALVVSANILNTSTDYLPQAAGSMEQHLALRTKALQDLASFLKRHCDPLSRTAKWKLLSDAERLAAARALWKAHDHRISEKKQASVTLLEEGIDAILERFREDGHAKGDIEDDVRLFFTKKLDNVERLMQFCFGIIKERLRSGGTLHSIDLLRLVSQMNDMLVLALGTAYRYRQQHRLEYGLGDEDIKDGVLAVGYEDLDRFWTSCEEVVKTVGWSIKLTHDTVSTVLNKDGEGSKAEEAETVARTMEDVIRLSCKSHVEGFRWLLSRSDEASKQKGTEMKDTFENQLRRDQISYLYNVGQIQRGLVLAEDLEDIPSLVELALQELDFQKEAQMNSGKKSTSTPCNKTPDLNMIEQRIQHFFRKFGQKFAEPFYAGQVASHRLADLINVNLGNAPTRTMFLRSDHSRGKISWINDVLAEDDFLQAGETLMHVAKDKESNVWSRKIELSIAKLTLMALPDMEKQKLEAEANKSTEMDLKLANKHALEIARVQQRLGNFVRPAIVDALDEEAKLVNVMASFGQGLADTRSSLSHLLKLGFSELISHRAMKAEQLIDVLTLMNLSSRTGNVLESEIGDDQFYLSLRVLESASWSQELSHDAAQKLRALIWKRCIVSQDWNEFGRTTDLSDSDFQEGLKATAVFHTIKHGVKEGMWPAFQVR